MRNYLVVVDDSSESRLAQRFAARRASQTGGAVHLISIIEQQQFVAWGGVQATIEEEARQAAEGVAQAAATALRNDHNVEVTITVGIGDPAAVVRSVIAENFDIAALVLGAAANGAPGPLVSHFSGYDAGTLTVPIMIVPGSLSDDALDKLT